MSDLKGEILLSAEDMDTMVSTMSECGIETHKIPWHKLIKFATAMELHKLKAIGLETSTESEKTCVIDKEKLEYLLKCKKDLDSVSFSF